ncbi:MAG TPA: chemotaxis protein CheW, partial [Geobacteraceae bacterium]
ACFRIGEDIYAVDIMRIKEIIRPQRLTVLPKAPAFVEGVLNLRGLVIPVIDLRKRFDMPAREIDQNRRLLIITLAGCTMGMAVDEVTEVITIPVPHIKPPPQLTQGVDAEYLVGVCLAKDSLIMLLNPDRLLSGRETAELGALEAATLEE